MSEVVFMLMFGGLVCVLLLAIVVPPPARPVANEADVYMKLLALGGAAMIMSGVLALAAIPAASMALGAVAWLCVMPCIWLGRAPRPSIGWEEDEDDDGGSPPPRSPAHPPAPGDRLPGLGPDLWSGARATAVTAPALTAAPAPATALGAISAWALPASNARPAELAAWTPASTIAITEPVGPTSAQPPAEPVGPTSAQPPAEPVGPAPARTRVRSPRTRGEQRDVDHARAVAEDRGRRRRGSLRRWILRRTDRRGAACASPQGSRMSLPSLPPAAKRP